jgi:hypothetical protein
MINFGKIKLLIATTALLMVAACGGGGSSTGAGITSSTEIFQVRNAFTSYVTNTSTYNGTLSGTVSGSPISGTFQINQGALVTTTFEGIAALRKPFSSTLNFTLNGQSRQLQSSDSEFYREDYLPLGKTSDDSYEVVVGNTAIPTTARVGDSGDLYVQTIYSSSAKNTITGRVFLSFVLEPDTATTAILKLIEVEKNPSNVVESTATVSFRITPAGQITRIAETLVSSESNITIKY